MRGREKKKLDLDPETLAVESFEAGETPGRRGTVEGQAAPCTCWKTCDCASGPWRCGGYAFTEYSCDWTFNASCDWPPPTQHTCADA